MDLKDAPVVEQGSADSQAQRSLSLYNLLQERASSNPDASVFNMARSAPSHVFDKKISPHMKKVAISTLHQALGDNQELNLMDRETFIKATAADVSELLSARLFDWLASEAGHGGLAEADELLQQLINFNNLDPEAQLQFMFHLWDQDNTGMIGAVEVTEILRVCFSMMKLQVDEVALKQVALACLERASGSNHPASDAANGTSKRGTRKQQLATATSLEQFADMKITYDQLRDMVAHYAPDSMVNATEQSRRPAKELTLQQLWGKRLRSLVKNLRRLIKHRYFPFYFVIVGGILASFIVGYMKNDHAPITNVIGASYPTAKAFAQVLQWVFAMLLIPITRHTLTLFRGTPLKKFIPFDDAILLHRMLGMVALVCAVGHSLAHFRNLSLEASGSRTAAWNATFPSKPQPTTHVWATEVAITGYIMLVAMLLAYMFLMRRPPQPAKGQIEPQPKRTFRLLGLYNFNNFYISHNLMFVVVYVCLIIHPYPGIYLAVPLTMHIAERLYRLVNTGIRQIALVDVQTLPGKVTVLRMRTPDDFNHTPGMYAFINIPQIANHEWHPFTITSAPGDPYLSLHIRGVGDWTLALYRYMEDFRAQLQAKDIQPSVFDDLDAQLPLPRSESEFERAASAEEVQQNEKNGAHVSHIAGLRDWERPLPGAPLINLDGPFNAPAQNWQDYDVLLFVGGGIGVTPFASVLADLVNKLNAHRCARCALVDRKAVRRAMGMSLEKIYFHWVVREAQPFCYFRYTLQTICAEDALQLVEAKVHLTGASSVKKNDLSRIITKMAHEAYHSRTRWDVVADVRGGSHVLTGFERPDWNAIVAGIVAKHPSRRVGVFICGADKMVDAVKAACTPYQSSWRQKLKQMAELAFATSKAQFYDEKKDKERDIEAAAMVPTGVKCIDVFAEHF